MIERSNHIGRIFVCLMVLCCCHNGLKAQEQSGANALASGSTVPATHVLGFEGIANNASGRLSVQGNALQFQKVDGSPAQIPIDSIRNLSLGEEDKQVGGAPLALTRAAIPFGGGRVIGLFSHKKYDTLTLEYLDSNGGLHGAIFLLNKGQGQVLRSELEAKRLPASSIENDSTKPGTEEGK
jgi:hypothetical protein